LLIGSDSSAVQGADVHCLRCVQAGIFSVIALSNNTAHFPPLALQRHPVVLFSGRRAQHLTTSTRRAQPTRQSPCQYRSSSAYGGREPRPTAARSRGEGESEQEHRRRILQADSTGRRWRRLCRAAAALRRRAVAQGAGGGRRARGWRRAGASGEEAGPVLCCFRFGSKKENTRFAPFFFCKPTQITHCQLQSQRQKKRFPLQGWNGRRSTTKISRFEGTVFAV